LPISNNIHIALIDAVDHVSKIVNPVIGFHAIDVINLIYWPNAVYIEPRKPMCQILRTIHTYSGVAFGMVLTGK